MLGKSKFSYDYPRPALVVDVVLVTHERRPRVLLIRRGQEPFQGKWALPGGFVNENEPLDVAAKRELEEETGLKVRKLEPLSAFGDPDRDPRGWVVSVAFLAKADARRIKPQAADDAAEVSWHPLDRPPPLAFDHAEILAVARNRLESGRRS